MLSELLVVELASVLAGPAVGQFFSELGARVIKIENARTGGDVTRSWKLPTEDPELRDSAYFRSVNHNKRSHFLDLTEAEDRDFALFLISEADVVIANFPPGKAEKLGVDAATLSALNPGLIYAQLDAFPPDRPARPAYDIVLQAETGFLSMTGTEEGEFCRMPVALIDLLAAHQLKEGILLALLAKASHGRGALVRTNLYDSALASLANQATNYLVAGRVAGPMGSRHPNIAPYGDQYLTSDGHRIVLAVGSDEQFARLVRAIDLELPAHLRTNAGRVAARAELNAALEPVFASLTIWEAVMLCESNGVPVGHVKNIKQVFAGEAAQRRLLTYPDAKQTVKSVAFTVEEWTDTDPHAKNSTQSVD